MVSWLDIDMLSQKNLENILINSQKIQDIDKL